MIKDNCRRICLSTNSSCNLDCVYCYEQKHPFSFDERSATTKMLEMLSATTKNGTRIKLHGGEPFLIFKKIRYFCERLWEANLEEEFMIHCTTNGTLIHGPIQEWLALHKNQIRVKLSLDGDRSMQNANRSSSYGRIDLDFFLRTWPDIEIKMTVSPLTIGSFARGVIFLHEKGFRNISPSFAEMVDWSDESLPQSFYRELVKLNAYYQEHLDVRPCSWYMTDISRLISDKCISFPCRIGQKTAIDFNTGKEYPCHLFFDSTASKAQANALLKVNLSLRENIVSKECDGCVFLPICHTCYVANYLTRGHTASRDMSLCILQKCIYVAICEHYYSRIIKKKSRDVSTDDYRMILAIKKVLPELEVIKKSLVKA